MGELSEGVHARLSGMEARLEEEILGQREATRLFARAILRGELGCVEPGRPRSFTLLLGETGVGKTETVLVSARQLHGAPGGFVRLDMAEYAERTAGLGRLLGEGREDRGLLALELERARTKKGGVFLLLDEIEKAHPDVTRLFLGMEAARLTNATGETLDLTDVHIVCTTNLGSESARALDGQVPYAYLRSVVEEEARAHFGSAVYARFADVIVYRSLDYTTQRRICEQKLARKLAFLGSSVGVSLSAGAEVLDYLVRRGYHRDLGARMMRHVIDRELGDALVETLKAGLPAQALSYRVRGGALFLSPVVQE